MKMYESECGCEVCLRKAFGKMEADYMNYEVLSKPFEKGQVKQRPGSFVQTYKYVPSGEIIKRLNEAGDWDCRIVEKIVDDDEVTVLIELRIEGSERQQWGGKARKGVSLSDALKAATSDGIKKAASLFGVALDLHEDEDVPAAPQRRDWKNQR